MPYVTNHGVRIYYEVEGQGPNLVLQHGFTSSMVGWKWAGYTHGLREDYRLILIDARGHGQSSKPHDPQAYSPQLMTSDIITVLDDLQIEQAHFWGYSMGGKIGFQLPRYYSTRFCSYIIGGMSPYLASTTSPQVQNNRQRQLTMLHLGMEHGPKAVIDWRAQRQGMNQSQARKNEILNNDFHALHAWWVYNTTQWPDAVDLLSMISVPCLLYVGEQDFYHDGAKQAAEVIRQATFVSLPHREHGEVFFDCGELVLPHVKRFLSQMT
jgi:pimeloyl-ACP methyl ester carboxylesterase